jgi:PAS domain S-box-containing protein
MGASRPGAASRRGQRVCLVVVAAVALAAGAAAPVTAQAPAERRAADAAVGGPSGAPVTKISVVRTADPSILGKHVVVEGVVTYADPHWGLLFVQDDEQGIFVQMRGRTVAVAVGDRVRAEGVASAGDFAPIIDTPSVFRLGPGRLPAPAKPDFQKLLTGEWDSQHVELEGIVRGLHPLSVKEGHLLFDVAVGTWRVLAQLPGRWTGERPEYLVDSRVRIRGVAGTLFNQQQQLVGLQLFVPSLAFVTPLSPPQLDPFAAPVHAIASLNRWVSRHGLGRRVRIRGEVTWARGRQVYVRDRSGSIAATLWSEAPLTPGQAVDVAGFVAAGTYSPTLEDAVVRSQGGRVEPAAAEMVAFGDLMGGRHDAALVTLEAEVVSHVAEPDLQLVLRVGDDVFTANGPAGKVIDGLEAGAVVQVTGVCRVQVDPLDTPRVPRGIQLLMRSGEDVQLLKRATFSPHRTLQALLLLFSMVLAGLFWIVSLRRRVQQQTQDLREQLDRERALEAQYRELVATANDLVVTSDADARVTSINDAGVRMTGLRVDQAAGRPLRELVAPADRARLDRVLAAVIANRAGATLEVGMGHATVELDVRPIFRHSRPAGLQAIGRDVTARKRSEAELANARDAAEAASRAKSEFLANISHEVRTPLNGIIGMTELALAGHLEPEPRQYLTLVRSSADSLLHIINDILDFSKIEAGHLTFERSPFDLRARLSDILEPLAVTARRKGLAFETHVAAALPEVAVGDPGRLGQVLTNLVGNAIKFTADGGVRVDVDIAPTQSGDGPATVRLRVAVRDTGIGIPADKHAMIFEAFTQADGSTSRRFGGTGLGLSIAASIVRRMGGSLDLTSEIDRGSTFTAVLPFDSGTAAELPAFSGDGLSRLLGPVAAGAADKPAVPLHRVLRILLVEDNPVNQRLAHEVLRRRGHAITVANHGREALDRLAEASFDLVLMDVQMPEMNGLAATEAIRAAELGTGRHLPIVAMTAHAMAGDRERCLAAGMDDYLTKPIRAEALITHVERMAMRMDESPGRPPAPAFDLAAALERVDHDEDLLAEIAGLFLKDAPEMLAAVAGAVAVGDADAVNRTAHRLKGSILTFGAEHAAAFALSLEEAGRNGALANAQADLARLAQAVARLRTALESYLVTLKKTA